jgi:lycopene cyclase domain-containing protein
MRIEYLLLNILILSGPVFLSFDRKVRYVRYWPMAFGSILTVAVPFWIWDMLVSGKHWRFNEAYTLPVRIMGLPLGEILFFISVPFACLFIWQILVTRYPARSLYAIRRLWLVCVLFGIAAVLLLAGGKTYSGLVCTALAATAGLDLALGTAILNQKRTARYMAIVTGLILVFNGYLTARPVVLYEDSVISGVRIGTIPIEDFGYGYALILLCTIIYEKWKSVSYG